MAVGDVKIFHKLFPEAFDPKPYPPPGWEDWRAIPISTSKRNGGIVQILQLFYSITSSQSVAGRAEMDFPSIETIIEHLRQYSHGKNILSPDVLAYYLSFHSYYAEEPSSSHWGIYLVLEHMATLINFIYEEGKEVLSIEEAEDVCRVFLYGAKVYHHAVESFVTRLEIVHRKPLYEPSFEHNRALEEGLAAAHGLQRVHRHFQQDPDKRKVTLDALRKYIEQLPPGYKSGLNYIVTISFFLA